MINRRALLRYVPRLTLGGILTSGVAGRLSSAPTVKVTDAAFANIYASLNVVPLINARGTVTIVGATRMLPEVKEAMDAASRQYVHIDELMQGVGVRLAELTGAEWGCITSGASAAITMATAACVSGGDPDKLWKIPKLAGMNDEVIIPSYSRTAYECAARAVGTKMVEVSSPAALENALGPRTAMILVLTGASSDAGPLSIKEIAKRAKPLGVPILADAAAEELTVPNKHLMQGADLVAYSGGKCMRGPQCAGLLLGRRDLVEASWMVSAPHHGFARGHKVGREEILGMLTAVEMWFRRDHQQENRVWNEWLSHIREKINPLPKVTTEISQAGAKLSNRFPTMRIQWDPTEIPLTGYDVENLLWNGNPRIAVSGAGSFLPFPPNMQPNIQINPSQLESGEEQIIANRLFEILSKPPTISKATPTPAFDINGQWELNMHFCASSVDQTLFLEQEAHKLSGTHIGSYAARNLSGTLHGNNILIRSSYTGDGTRLNFEFSGIVDGDHMEGNVSLGEYGMAKWTAKRKTY
ncbi:MAG: aminotransferase class V-fold PLP-dependent enzyme [Saprospiraceae bacterium]|nr:aminotransferase class V-fold PLP-dependent enzyme [Saprospiraceae bacterium]